MRIAMSFVDVAVIQFLAVVLLLNLTVMGQRKVDFLPENSGLVYSEEDKVLHSWNTSVSLKFCHGEARVCFHPPLVPWHELQVRVLPKSSNNLKDSSNFNFHQLQKLVDVATGFACVNFSGIRYHCSLDCEGFKADVRVLSYTNTLHCSLCKRSETIPGCIYFPNGSSLLTNHDSKMANKLANHCQRDNLLPKEMDCQMETVEPSGGSSGPTSPDLVVISVCIVIGICFLIALVFATISYNKYKQKKNGYTSAEIDTDETTNKLFHIVYSVNDEGIAAQLS